MARAFRGDGGRVCARGHDRLALRCRGDRAGRPPSHTSPIRRRRPPGAAANSVRRPMTATATLQLRLLLAGELPEAWIPPAHILELRTRVRLRKTLIDQRTAWLQRLQAQLFHQGVPAGLKPRTARRTTGACERRRCPQQDARSSSSARECSTSWITNSLRSTAASLRSRATSRDAAR